MIQPSPEHFEERIQRLAGDFRYPAAPDLTARVAAGIAAHRRVPRWQPLARVALVVLILLAGISLLVPSVRAAVLEFLQIGGLRIYLQTPTSVPTVTQNAGALPGKTAITPAPTSTPPSSLFSTLNLSGETSLEQASQKWGAPILLPAPDSGLGLPDRVFLQNSGGSIMILFWLDPADQERLLASLIILKPGAFLSKNLPGSFESVQVRGQNGLWLQGEHFLFLKGSGNDQGGITIQVQGNVLAWEEDGLTYRLESLFDLEQSQAVAESMQPYP